MSPDNPCTHKHNVCWIMSSEQADAIARSVKAAWCAIRTGFTTNDVPAILLTAKRSARNAIRETFRDFVQCTKVSWDSGCVQFDFKINTRLLSTRFKHFDRVVSDYLRMNDVYFCLRRTLGDDTLVIGLRESVFGEFVFCDDLGIEDPYSWIEGTVKEFLSTHNVHVDDLCECDDIIHGLLWRKYRFSRWIPIQSINILFKSVARHHAWKIDNPIKHLMTALNDHVPRESRNVVAVASALRKTVPLNSAVLVDAIALAWGAIKRMNRRDMKRIVSIAKSVVDEYVRSKNQDDAMRCVSVCWDMGNLTFCFAVAPKNTVPLELELQSMFVERTDIPLRRVLSNGWSHRVDVLLHEGVFRQHMVCDESDAIIDPIQQMRNTIIEHLSGASLTETQMDMIDDFVNHSFGVRLMRCRDPLTDVEISDECRRALENIQSQSVQQ